MYSDPVELLPYATSGEADRNSDSGTDDQTRPRRICNSHQSIPLPPKPDDANSPALSGRSLADLNHATPPPPYSANAHAPVPPVRQLPNTLLPSIVQQSLADQPQATAVPYYFLPISDEETDNPAFESAENAYLIPRQKVESQDSAENNMTYLVPTTNSDTEDAGGAMDPASSTELCSGSEVMYAIRSLSSEPSEAKSNKPLLHK